MLPLKIKVAKIHGSLSLDGLKIMSGINIHILLMKATLINIRGFYGLKIASEINIHILLTKATFINMRGSHGLKITSGINIHIM